MSSGSSNRKTYFAIFAILFVLTIIEVAVADPRFAIGKVAVGVSLVGLALLKAGMVAWFFMHLNHERKALKWTVVGPFLVFAIYPVVLIIEATVRRIQ